MPKKKRKPNFVKQWPYRYADENDYDYVPIDEDLERSLVAEIDKTHEEIRTHLMYNGEPYEWKGNELSLSICETCPLEDTCIRYNNWLERPRKIRATFDRILQIDHVIRYDEYGNRENQGIDVKTGEMK